MQSHFYLCIYILIKMTRKVSKNFDKPFGVTINPNGEKSLSQEARISLDYLRFADEYFKRLKGNFDAESSDLPSEDIKIISDHLNREGRSKEKSFTIDEMLLAVRGISKVQAEQSSLVLGLFSCERRKLVIRTRANGKSLYSFTPKGEECLNYNNAPSSYFEPSRNSHSNKYQSGKMPRFMGEN
jgi:hypothetical protein